MNKKLKFLLKHGRIDLVEAEEEGNGRYVAYLEMGGSTLSIEGKGRSPKKAVSELYRKYIRISSRESEIARIIVCSPGSIKHKSRYPDPVPPLRVVSENWVSTDLAWREDQ